MGIISSFKVFDHISVLTNGGPGNSSSVMAFYIYRTAFENFQMGYANALAWVLFIAIFIITLLQMRGQSNFTAE
jgi:multiple sugar transport system permease protein